MDTVALPSRWSVVAASVRREWLSHRLNRFLHAHLTLVAVAGTLPLLTPDDGLARGAVWWILHAVLYAISLSTLLLGHSSAQAEAEEFVWLLGQPRGVGPWLGGKLLALGLIAAGSSALLAVPTLLASAGSPELATAVAGAAALSVVGAGAGLATGFWIRDPVRGLIAVVGLWFALLFGTDLLLLGIAGAPWIQDRPDAWVAPLMLNPFDAFRITVLFAVEHAAFAGLNAGRLAGWWTTHSLSWLGTITAFWALVAAFAAWRGANRRLD